jgi:linoleoyl-CoA desaturase
MKTKTLKFANENKVEFMKELREKVDEHFEKNNLSKHADSEMVFKTFIMLILYIGPYLLMMTGVVTSAPLILLCWIVMGLGLSGVGMTVMHDANHGGYSANPQVNKWVGSSLLILGGLPETWRIQHNTVHHQYTNIDGYDADIDPAPMLRFSPHKPLRKIHRYQHIYAWFLYGLMTIMWITTKDFQQLFKYRERGMLANEKSTFYLILIKLVISKLLYYILFIALPIIILPIPWYLTLLFFVIMHFIAGVILSTVFQTAHVMPDSAYPLPDEKGYIDNNWNIHQLSVTTNYAMDNRFLTWALGGLNYHAIHHLFPNICHVHYKDLAPIIKETTDKHGVLYRVQPTFFSAVSNHAKMLKLLGQRAYL